MKNATRRFALFMSALGLMVGAAGQAKADLVTFYTDRSAFEAASLPLTTLDFGPLITNGLYQQGYPFGFTLQGENFVADEEYLWVRAPGALRPDASLYGPHGGYIGVNLASGTLDVGTNLLGFYAVPGTLSLNYTLIDGTQGSFNVPTAGGTFFFGITSDTPIKIIYYYNSNDYPVIDGFEANLGAVPEPSTLVVSSVVGLMSLTFAWRKRRAKVAA